MTDQELFNSYIDNVAAFYNCTKLNGQDPDESLMRRIEEAVGISEQYAWDFRVSMLAKVAASHRLGNNYDWRTDQNLVHAIQQIVGGG
jgi:serine protein kinase